MYMYIHAYAHTYTDDTYEPGGDSIKLGLLPQTAQDGRISMEAG